MSNTSLNKFSGPNEDQIVAYGTLIFHRYCLPLLLRDINFGDGFYLVVSSV